MPLQGVETVMLDDAAWQIYEQESTGQSRGALPSVRKGAYQRIFLGTQSFASGLTVITPCMLFYAPRGLCATALQVGSARVCVGIS